MTDVGLVVDVELCQQIVVARRRIDFRSDFGLGERIGDRIGFAKLSFDLNEERHHP